MFIIIAMVDINFIQAQTEGDKNIEIIKEFYFKNYEIWEITDQIKFKNELFKLYEKYCTIDLQTKLKNYYKYGIDEDIIMDNAITDSTSLKNTFNINKLTDIEDSYIISFIAYSSQYPDGHDAKPYKVTIIIKMKKENGIYKIDDIEKNCSLFDLYKNSPYQDDNN